MTKLLLIEDDRDVLEAMVGILEALGYQVDTATDGARALTVLRTANKPHVILLDLMMPNMDGYRFRATMREDPELARIPVIVITADRRVDEASLGVVCLKKPFDPEDLVAAIKRVQR
ncbi:MAG: response regulator [Polyangiales bacterium]